MARHLHIRCIVKTDRTSAHERDVSFALGNSCKRSWEANFCVESTSRFGDARMLRRKVCNHYSAALVVLSDSRLILRGSKITPATIPLSEGRTFVSDTVALQYVGFETKGAVREYAFTLRTSGGESSEYFVTIANAAFVAHRVRYQDAPHICSLRLHREFAT